MRAARPDVEAREQLIAAAAGERVFAQGADSRPLSRPRRSGRGFEGRPWLPAAAPVGRGPFVVPDIPQEPRIPCGNPRCLAHTEHRYRHDIVDLAADPAGHDLVVVAFNPHCPDTIGSPTFRHITNLAAALRVRTAVVVNLCSLRSGEPSDLDATSIPSAGWEQNRAHVDRALADATLVITAWGTTTAARTGNGRIAEERRHIEAELRVGISAARLQVGRIGPGWHPSVWVRQSASLPVADWLRERRDLAD